MRLKHWMRRLFLLVGTMAAYVACAPVEFSKMPEKTTDPGIVTPPSCQNFTEGCVTTTEYDEFSYSVTIEKPKADILFVNDNSGSMSFEQNRIAVRFRDFISALDGKGTDYRIGVITTDISTSPNNPKNASNGNGAFQDGKLIAFGDGSKFLTPDSANRDTQFSEIMKRQETLRCEKWLESPNTTDEDRRNNTLYAEMCPSGDERGIYAINLALKNNEGSWLREGVPLAIVIISDEDVRSFGEDYQSETYKPAYLDTPESVVENLNTIYRNSKALSVHPIIVRPGDQACLWQQNDQLHHPETGYPLVNGKYGSMYEKLRQQVGGVLGNVCASDYSQQMGRIGTTIVDTTPDVPSLACDNPQNLEVSVSPQQNVRYDLQGRNLKFTSNLRGGSVVNLKYKCERQK